MRVAGLRDDDDEGEDDQDQTHADLERRLERVKAPTVMGLARS